MTRFCASGFALGLTVLWLQPCLSMPWEGPMETPLGLMATAGISPRPTDAPGFNGIPKELKPRQNALQYPPPAEWCGLVEGLTDDILSCSVGLTCINRGNAVGCCPSVNGACTALYTTCANYGDTCNSACEANISIRKCSDSAFPYCGSYSFAGGTFLYNCQSTSMFIEESVEYLADYYSTAIGSTLAPSANLLSYTGATSLPETATDSATASSHSSTVGSSSSTSSNNDDDDNSAGLAGAAIGGIAAGISVLVCAVAGIIVFFCLRSRKRKRLAASQAMTHAPPSYQPPPMQQQQTGYQSVPQQDNQFQGSPNYQPTQAGYFGGPTDPQKDQGTYSHVSPVGSPSPSNVEPRPFSTVSSQPGYEQRPNNLSPPVPGAIGGGGAAQEYYKPPNSPTVTEVDGTQGNPGVPHGHQPGVLEVDGTAGNPGVPYDHQHYQGPYEMH